MGFILGIEICDLGLSRNSSLVVILEFLLSRKH